MAKTEVSSSHKIFQCCLNVKLSLSSFQEYLQTDNSEMWDVGKHGNLEPIKSTQKDLEVQCVKLEDIYSNKKDIKYKVWC